MNLTEELGTVNSLAEKELKNPAVYTYHFMRPDKTKTLTTS